MPPIREFRLPPRVGVAGERPLTLDDALMMALNNNLDIEISRIDQQRAGFSIDSAKGVFDPRFAGATSFQRNVTPIASSLGGSATGAVTTKNATLDPQFIGLLERLGSSYQVDFSSQRSTTNNSFTQLNPTYPTSLNFSYTQPLLRGFRFDDNRRKLAVAKKNQSLTDEQFRQRVMETTTRAEQAYWDLVFAYRNLQVQVQAVQLGRDQDASNRRQQEQGLLAAIDVVAAQRQLTTFEVGAYTAQESLSTAENAIKTLILADRGDPLWSTALIPVTPVNLSPPVIPLADAVNEALASRPELAQLRASKEINETDNRYYREQTKPQVDVIALHTNAGLSGAILPAGPNPFTAGLTSITNQVNQLSTLAGIQPLPTTSTATASLPDKLIGNYGQS
ncbi:MAG: TolC family protein, partial [Acidobacteriota bacterium]